MPAAASGEADGAGAGPAPKPFLRCGSGWQARVEAAREGRRYVPRGGPIKDYSKDEELPARLRAPRGRAAAPASRIPRSPAKAAAPLGAAPGASGSYARARSVATAAASPTKGQRQSAARRPSGPAALPGCPAAQPPSNNRELAADSGPREAAPATNHWASKLLSACPMPSPAASTHQAQQRPHAPRCREEVALQEFEALESQVLREVGNSPRRSPGSWKKAPPSATTGSGGALGWPAAAAAPWPVREQGTIGAVAQHEEDVFQSDGEGNVTCQAGSAPAHGWAEAEAAAIAHPLARRSVSFGLPPQAAPAARLPHPSGYVGGPEDEEAEMEAESSFVQEHPLLPSHPGLVQQQQISSSWPAVAPAAASAAWQQHTQQRPLQSQQQRQLQPQPAPLPSLPDCEASAVEQLQQEVVRLQEERARVARLRMDLEEAAGRMEAEQAAWEKRKLEEAARFESERAEELRKLQRDRRVLEKQSRAILKMPTKQSKEEVAAVEALLAEERKAGRAREARHKLATERLRQQVLELQGRNAEMREQIHHLEQQRLQQQAWAAGSSGPGSAQAAADPAPAAGVQAAALASTAGAVQLAAGRQRLPSVRVERGGHASQAGTGSTAASARPAASAGRGTQPGRGLAPGQPVVSSNCDAAAPIAGVEVQEEDEGEPLIADVELGEGEVIECFLDSAAGDAQQLMPATAGPLAGSPLCTLGPAGHADAQLAAPTAAPTAAAGPGAAAASVMDKASSALARFNQLRASLAQHEAVQQRLASRMSSLQASPQLRPQPGLPAATDATAAASFVAAPAPVAAGGSDDDLRRLGRSLLASGSSAAAVSLGAEELQPDSQVQQQVQQQVVPLPGTPDDSVVSEVQQPDGRWERTYASGLLEQHFGNGSTKQQLPGSGASLTRFANGDVKKVLPCGAVEYFYAEVASWQVTHASGVDVFFFPSGQVEAHHPGGVKEILFPDGAVRKVLPDGRELPISAAHLSREIQQAQPVPQLAA